MRSGEQTECPTAVADPVHSDSAQPSWAKIRAHFKKAILAPGKPRKDLQSDTHFSRDWNTLCDS
ncbi:hypothetical protein JZ751_011096 [Albula glossodonta]|uniref:Uncharacterized protein n=1 Tax=Albula glossodonta TaxID=121402 RepID=A0A8T2NY29_9TELE|nr:hypothetical protein JZ751_011096 [Albula glossodonta]